MILRKLEVLLEDGTVIYSGFEEYKSSGNLKDKYPTGRTVVERLLKWKEQTSKQKSLES